MTQESICCQFGRESYQNNSLVTALLRATYLTEGTQEDGTCYVQASGHIVADPRWIKLPCNITDIFRQNLSFPVEQNVKLPRNVAQSNGLSPVCIFVTPREVVSVSQLLAGLFVQFELPSNILPTFKGLTVSIFYSISVVLQRGTSYKQFFFPFIVCSKGNSLSPQEIRYPLIGNRSFNSKCYKI